MVFESMVSDLLNRFIGDYVENLDKSQLKIGIWGGEIRCKLSEFDVPFKVKTGQIGKLTLKIPWKNLYNDAVVATLDGLYLLVVPGATIKYDAAKEERYQQEAKQKELQRIEEALQISAKRASQSRELIFSLQNVVYQETHNGNHTHTHTWTQYKCVASSTKPQDEKKDTFMEKLATQVIKNLQVKITSIHLRYEDDLSDPQRPLSLGVTLSELSLQTADENWKPCILNEAAKIINKVTVLPASDWSVVCSQGLRSVGSKVLEPATFEASPLFVLCSPAVFRPIFAFAKMIINPTAEMELTMPKLDLHLEVQDIAIEMNRGQYLSMLELLASVDCMVKNAPYRKFRPNVSVHKNSKLWWRYAFNSILEVHVRRLTSMWSWSNIWRHRQHLKAYKMAYKTRLLNPSKSSQETEGHIQELEKVLDVFNITLARQQAQMEVIRSGQKVVEKKGAPGQKQGGGFFSGWFGRKAKKEEQEETKETQDEIMTLEEKEKLYTAIGYSGSSHNLALPKHYVAVVVTFQLLQTSVTVREKPNIPETIWSAALRHWFVTGLQQEGVVPSLIASVGDSSSSLLNVLFELNPQESSADQLLRVHSQPVEMIYDALTVNSVVEFFRTGRGVDLKVLTSATLSKLEKIKEKTAAGLSHIIETRKVLDLRIDLKPSYLLVPMSGFYSSNANLILIDFGSLQLNSVKQSSPVSSSSSLEEIMDRAYERFDVELKRVQVEFIKARNSCLLGNKSNRSLMGEAGIHW
uniref:Chorein N-terminal domain-containing protein n=1 Tax=Cynoglossus semilaevis TaxID=244447 RepID=A0A3P8UT30_CYNSE